MFTETNPTVARSRGTRRRRTLAALCALLFLAALLAAPPPIRAQGDDDEPQSEELTRLRVLKAEAEARAAIAKAKREEFNARFPQSELDPLEGKTTLTSAEKLFVEEVLVGYISVAEAAEKIAAAIKTADTGYADEDKVRRIVVWNDGDVQALVVYSAATKRVSAYTNKYAALKAAMDAALRANRLWKVPNAECDKQALAAFTESGTRGGAFNALGAATSVLGSFGDLLSFFRTDVQIRGGTFAVDESVLVTEVFRALRKTSALGPGVELYYPREFPPNFDPASESEMLKGLETLLGSKAEAAELARRIEELVAAKTKQIEVLEACKALADQTLAAPQKALAAEQKKAADAEKKVGELVEKIGAGPASRKDAQELKAARAALEAAKKEVEAAEKRLEERRAALQPIRDTHEADVEKLRNEIAALRAAAAPRAALDAEAELLVRDMVKVDDKTGINPLTAFIRSESIQKVMSDGPDGKSYWLKLKVVNAGGNTKTKTNLILDVFNGGQRVRYSGASTVEYHLYSSRGRSLLSDTTNGYVDYMKAKDVKKLADAARQAHDQQ